MLEWKLSHEITQYIILMLIMTDFLWPFNPLPYIEIKIKLLKNIFLKKDVSIWKLKYNMHAMWYRKDAGHSIIRNLVNK